MTQIIVKNLSDNQNEKYQNQLKTLFSKFGTIIADDYEVDSYNSAIFEYETIKDCYNAIKEMNGKTFKGDKILVKYNGENFQQELFFDVDYSKKEIIELLNELILPSQYIKNLSINVLLIKKENSYTLINFDTKKGIIPKNIFLEDIDIFLCNYINLVYIENENKILDKYHDVNLFIGKLYRNKYILNKDILNKDKDFCLEISQLNVLNFNYDKYSKFGNPIGENIIDDKTILFTYKTMKERDDVFEIMNHDGLSVVKFNY